MPNYRKLAGRITERFGTRSAFARHLGWTESVLSNRLNGKVPFDVEDIVLFSLPENLDIPKSEIGTYFFA